MIVGSTSRTVPVPSRRRRWQVGAAAMLAIVVALGPADPATAFYAPMPTPTGPHHYHREKNPSAAALALMTSKQKSAIERSSGERKTYGKVRCVQNCIDPTLRSATATVADRQAASSYAPILCSWFAIYIYAKNFSGAKIWQFEIRTDYCRNSGTARIVSHKTTVHPTVYTWASVLGWQYKGTTEVSSWEPFDNSSAVRTYAQGHFDYCPPRIWCVQSKYPYAYLDVYGTGDRLVSKWGA
jgi:hypothetical protein